MSILYKTIGSLSVLRYYVQHPKATGIVGRGSFKVWRERCWISKQPEPNRPDGIIWVHAAGPGDARAAQRLIEALLTRTPSVKLHVTCGTYPARQYLEKSLRPIGCRVRWFPFDLPGVISHYLRAVRPDVFVCAQGEPWPNLLRYLAREGIPSVLLRVHVFDWQSQREFPGWLLPFYREALSYVSLFSVPSTTYRERLLGLGVPHERILVTQDYRVNILTSPKQLQDRPLPEALSGPDLPPILVLAGLRPEEFVAIAPLLWEHVASERLIMIAAPAELDTRFANERFMRDKRIACVRYSRLLTAKATGAVVLLDTFGDLFHLYSLARLVLIGDTFPPSFGGGRNYWEVLAQGARLLYGPELASNDALEELEGVGYAWRVQDYADVPASVEEDLRRHAERDLVRGAATRAFGAQLEQDAAMLDAEAILARFMPQRPRESVPEKGGMRL